MKSVRYALEAVIIFLTLVFFRLLPLDVASGFAGWLARIIGPLLRVHHTAEANMEQALPELTPRERQRALSAMWDNLGRVIGEYPHLARPVMARRIHMEGREHLERVKTSGKGALFVSGHFANWEIGPLAAAHCGLPLALIYREPNNPHANRIIRRLRGHHSSGLYSKGRNGARETMRALKEGRGIGVLVDQKMNDGSAIPFFGREAMTATAVTQLAIRLGVPLLLTRTVRTDGAHFHVLIEPPIHYAPGDDPLRAMTEINLVLERWVREHPGQWLWVHNRWGKNKKN